MIRIGKILVIGFVILSSTCGFAQIDRDENVFYKYYKGEKLYLSPNYNHIIVPSKNITQIYSYFGENIVIKEINDQKSVIKLLSNNINEVSLNNVLMKLDSLSENRMKLFYIFGKDSMVRQGDYFYIKLHSNNDIETLCQLSTKYQFEIIKKIDYLSYWYMLKFNNLSTIKQLETLHLLHEANLFDEIEPDFIPSLSPYNNCAEDSLFGEQWGLKNDSCQGIDINVCKAWKISSGKNIVIAIVDTGVDTTHFDFKLNNCTFYDVLVSDSVMLIYGNHGTKVGSVIFAKKDNIGLRGISDDSHLMSISVIGHGADDFFLYTRANAINYAWTHDADIINCSWGFYPNKPYNSSLLDESMDSAAVRGRDGKGVVLVFGSGNEGLTTNTCYPSNANIALTVGSIKKNGQRSSFSDCGIGLSVVAPGEHILLSTFKDSDDVRTYYVDYDNGTSFAAPHVSGVAALMLSVNPNLTGQQVRNIIESTAQKLAGYNYQPSSNDHPNGTWNNEIGYGLVDAYAAVVEACLYGHLITGDTNVQTCQISSFTYEGNLSDSFEIYWKVSPNCVIYSGQNSTHVEIIPNSGDTATLYAYIILNEDTLKVFSKKLHITDYNTNIVTPNLSNGIPLDNVWNTEYTLTTQVTIPSGRSLTINADVSCMPHVKIIVENGGRLVINNAEMSSHCDNLLWKGIEVWGSPDEAQYSVNRNVTSPQQGEVVLNNAVIKNAVCGVRVGRQNLRNISKGGGVVKATNTQFVNNQRAVHFYAYSHVNAYNRVVDNISYFNECTFSVDEHAYFSVDTSNVQVALHNVRGVQFNGCVFEDLQTKTNWKKYGTALYACQAGFRINGQPDNPLNEDPYYSTPCTFNNYKNAIAIVGSAEKPVKIYNTLFSDNSAGVNAKNADALSILSCSFSNGSISYNIDVHGLILDSCNFYRIENNQFSGIGNGIKIIGKTENNNTIRLNTFNQLCRAIEVYGTNGTNLSNGNPPSPELTGLQFECNEFITDSTDIYIANQAIIKYNQGWWQKACGNYFGTQSFMHFNNLNMQTPFFYFYNTNVPAQMPSRYNYLFITSTTPDICGERHGYIGDSYYDMQATISNYEDRYDDHLELYLSALDNYNATYGGISIDWNNVTSLDESSNPQLFDLIQLSELKNILDETCIEAIHLLGNATEVEITEITTWLQRLSSLDADLLGIHYISQGNDVSQLQLAWDQITQHYSGVNSNDTSYYQYCINQLNAWARDTSSNVNISQGAIDSITAIANSNNTASFYAVSVLECINEFEPWWKLKIHTSCNWVVPVESMSPKKETDQGQTDAIQLHPNPTNGMIEIQSNNLNIKQIELYDIFGKLLIEKKANESTVTLDVSPYAKGMYLLRYTLSDDTQQTKKIIKE